MKIVTVRLGSRSYSIIIGRGIISECAGRIARLGIGRDAVVITNKRLMRMYGRGLARTLERRNLSVRFEIAPDSEKAKSIGVATRLINRISAYDVGKKIFIVAFGGGVIGDLAGFVASVYKRGIPYVQMPTTLLAQVDSAIGGKVAVDLAVAKNLVGSFHQPRLVVSDVSLLSSLPMRQLKSGLSEVVKYGIISDDKLFGFLEENHGKILRRDLKALEHIVTECSRIKSGVVAKDELDKKGVRAILNYGHTIGHAIESASSYSGRYTHGEAIAIGMLASADISCRLGMMDGSSYQRIVSLMTRLGLPKKASGLRLPDIYASHLHDKKFIAGTNRFVLPRSIGSVKLVSNVPYDIIRAAIRARLG